MKKRKEEMQVADKKKEEQTGYQSKWQSQLDDVTDKILNREKFSYNLNGDAFYNQYKDRFVQQGKMAMMDTMGQAAALTGGYGSSYAQQVGQQTYQGYLQNLNDVVPELYQLALDNYNREGDALQNQFGLLADLDAQDYSKYRDQVADQQEEQQRQIAQQQWQAEFDEAKRQYDEQADLDREQWEWQKSQSADSKAGDSDSSQQTTKDDYANFPVEYDTHGYSTEEIKQMQKAAGITADGVWGPTTQAAYEAGYRPDASNINDNGFTGTTYKEAVAYLEDIGAPGSGNVMRPEMWHGMQAGHQLYGSGGFEVTEFDSYEEYLAAYVAYQLALMGE